MLIDGFQYFGNFSQNCIFCDQSNIFVNRAFVCHPKAYCFMNLTVNDEVDTFCRENHKNRFKCDGTKLIEIHFVCNHINDCLDGSDENYCGRKLGFFF